jgi:aminoglycoside phosphotransferase (APT) family kinase protein
MGKDRTDIYYWKCDRAAAFHGTDGASAVTAADVQSALETRFPGAVADVAPTGGQGNHRTFRARLDGREAFIRVEDGAEQDDYFAVENAAVEAAAALDVPVARCLAYDCSRRDFPFAWQALEYLPYPDLNAHFKAGTLDWTGIAPAIGRAVARWQEVRPDGFGLFSAAQAQSTGELHGLHATYEAYYRLNLDRHLRDLVSEEFLDEKFAARIRAAVDARTDLLALKRGVLVHKDLALWNILGTPDEAKAFIDWDDCIAGDPMDDLSLMGCFHGFDVLGPMLDGYRDVRPLPSDAAPRFWLGLLRNMIFKAVIRVGAGYFRRTDGFFLIGAGQGGGDLAATTRAKLELALAGLEKGLDLDAIA